MGEFSVFMDKDAIPTKKDLQQHLGKSINWWEEIETSVMDQYPGGKPDWNFPGKKYGWSYRIKDKRRAIIYFLPFDDYFKVGFVFGQKAYDEVMESDIDTKIKAELKESKKYAEGRGIRIPVDRESVIPDIKQLIEIKLHN